MISFLEGGLALVEGETATIWPGSLSTLDLRSSASSTPSPKTRAAEPTLAAKSDGRA